MSSSTRWLIQSVIVPALLLVLAAPGAAQAQAEGLELEARTDFWGLGALVGGRVSDRASMLLGLEGAGLFADTYDSLSVRVPLDIRVDLREVKAGAFVPIVRVGIAYGWGRTVMTGSASGVAGLGGLGGLSGTPSGNDMTRHYGEASLRAGVRYHFTEAVALGLEGGVLLSRTFVTDLPFTEKQTDASASWQLTLLLRPGASSVSAPPSARARP